MEKSSGLLSPSPQTTRTIQGICLFSRAVFYFHSTHHPLFLLDQYGFSGASSLQSFSFWTHFMNLSPPSLVAFLWPSPPRNSSVDEATKHRSKLGIGIFVFSVLYSKRDQIGVAFKKMSETELGFLPIATKTNGRNEGRRFRNISVLRTIFDPETRLNRIE
jgi:hypothetical protein